jgi:hypothetical protein
MISLFTSSYPYWENKRELPLPKSKLTIAEILNKNNYSTGGFVAACYVNSYFGFDRGFDTYDDRACFQRELVGARSINERAFEFLKANTTNKNFFLYLHYMNVHEIYGNITYDGLSRANTSQIIDIYDEKILKMDEEIARLLDELDKLNLTGRTMIIITADHGEGLYDHGHLGHGSQVYEELIHVPLIMSIPHVKNKSIRTQVRHIDIFPTILDVMNISIPTNIEGKSLIPLVNDMENEDRTVYAISKSSVAIRENNFKLIYNTQTEKEELYSLEDDPKEQTNLANKNLPIENKLEEKILEKINSMRREFKRIYPNLTEVKHPLSSLPILKLNETKLEVISFNPDIIYEKRKWPHKFGASFSELPQEFWGPWYSNGYYIKDSIPKNSNKKGIVLIHPKNFTNPRFLAQNVTLSNDIYVLITEVANIAAYLGHSCKNSDVIIKIKIIDHKTGKENTIYEDVVSKSDGWKKVSIVMGNKYANKNITFKIEGHAGGSNTWCGEFAAVNKFYIGRTKEELKINQTTAEKIKKRLRELGYEA